MPLRPAILALLVSLLTAGCGTLPDDASPISDPQAVHAARLFDEGHYQNAADLYLQLASQADAETRPIYQLLAADSLLHAADNDKAQQLLDTIQVEQLPGELANRYRLVQAELLLASGKTEEAVAVLDSIGPTRDRATRVRVETLRARAASAAGDKLAQARALMRLDQLLQEESKRLPVQLEILTILSRQPEEVLREGIGRDRVSQGWKELAALVRGFPNDPQGAAGPWHEWQALFPGHPALPELLITWYQQQQKLAPVMVKRVAILLPASGRYAAAAEAIRNGLLSAWYADPGEQRPQLLFYDSSDPEQVWPLLHQAADEGADLVVGPLTKQNVRQLARAGGLPLPVLALNMVNTDTQPPTNLFQFALAPEQEARQVALWAAARGLGRPGVLYPDTPWGERVYRAFQESWLTLGREPVRAILYHPSQGDYSQAVEELLMMKQARAEHARREEEAGEELPFQPELPVDFVFVVAGKAELLQLRPLISFHHGSRLPVMAISRAWNGRLDDDEALDLGGVMLPEIPWLVEEPFSGDPLSRENLARLFPQDAKRYPRLLAMGMDAYALMPNLSRLGVPGQEPLAGKTGELSLDSSRRIQRRLTWISLGTPPRVLGLTPPLESIDTSGWEAVQETAPELTPRESSAPASR